MDFKLMYSEEEIIQLRNAVDNHLEKGVRFSSQEELDNHKLFAQQSLNRRIAQEDGLSDSGITNDNKDEVVKMMKEVGLPQDFIGNFSRS